MNAYPSLELHGCDVDANAIQWDQQYLTGARFVTNHEWPPLPFPNEYFDALYAISVFTHLDRAHQEAWAAEVARIVSPNGVMVLTVHGPGLATSSREIPKISNVLCRRTEKLKGIHPDWYQTAFNAEEFTTDILRRHFQSVTYIAKGFGYQDAVICRR